jgi:DeoR family suf operon transcriptional repressor
MKLLPWFKGRQEDLLQALLQNKAGLTMEELSRELGISKAAVQQHVLALERDGLVQRKELVRTKGRPSYRYALTEEGIHAFPKHYDWFARLLLDHCLGTYGSEETRRLLYRLGKEMGETLRPRLRGKEGVERLKEVVALMTELGYQAELVEDPGGAYIRAFNCIYHHLARDYREVCSLDMGLLDALLGPVEQRECMVRGGLSCVFCPARLKPLEQQGLL